MPLTSMMPMLLRAPAPGPVASTSGKWPTTVAAVVIRIGRSRVDAASITAVELVCARSPADGWRTATIRIPFFDTRPDQRDQADLAVDVQRRQAEEREQQRARHGERHRSGEDDERIAEALELRGEHQVDQNRRQQERSEELAALGAQLPRLPRVVDREALRQDRARLLLEKAAAPGRAAPAAESRPGCGRH